MKRFCCVIVLLLAPHVALAGVEDSLEEAKRLYEAAGYEEALSALAASDDARGSHLVEVQQYRALCLIALGRMSDAEDAVTSLVTADPLYVPPSSVASPKVLGLISEIRTRVLPTVARRLLDDGRTAFTGKQLDVARENFDLLLRVLDDEAMQNRPEREDLRALAAGFATLAAASAAPPPAPALDAKPAGRPAPATQAVIPAVPLKEEFPVWTPDRFSARQEYTGTLQLQIGADGRVKSVRIQDPSHPAYDARIVQLARSWVYQPASHGGKAVDSERSITFKLRPPE